MQPQDLNAEMEILATIMAKNEAILDIVGIINHNDFYNGSNQLIYRTMEELYKEDIPIDPITISNKLTKEKLKAIGGITYLSKLLAGGLKSSNIKHYARIVKEKSNRRKLLEVSNRIVNSIDEASLPSMMAKLEDVLMSINYNGENKVLTDVELMTLTLEYVEANYKNGGDIVGMSTGMPSLDNAINGIVKKDLVVIAGRPSMGKTCLALNMASNMAFKNKVAFFELEMSAEKLGARRLAAFTGINATRLPRGNVNQEEWGKITARANEICLRNNMFTDTSSGISIMEIRSKAKKLKLKYGLDAVFIDHIGLLTPSNPKASRNEQIGEITRQAKIMAKELDVAVILLSQLNRGTEGRSEKRPQLGDLRESGNIEQDADLVMGVYRDEYYNPSTDAKDTMEVIILKQRDGKTGSVALEYKAQYQLVQEKWGRK